MLTFLNDLNTVQHEAVTYTKGPSLVIAGAGSGKTRVLTYKIAYLLENGFAPSSILALTFTNKAAREMKERITYLTEPHMSRYLWMGTFHSIFSRILRYESDKLGFPSSFTIYDSSDSKSLLKSIIKDLKLDDKLYKPGLVHSRISMAKNNLVLPQAYASNITFTEYDRYNKVPLIKDIYLIYMNRCKNAGAMDFDDLLLYTNILFKSNPDVLEKYQNQFKYVLVDEYQDTNISQNLITQKLAEKHNNVCVVGDDAQSIYSFRGAQLDNILKFPGRFDNCKVFKLEQNYRSTQNIVNAANSLINKNKEQFQKKTFSEKSTGNKIKLVSSYSDMEEGYLTANAIFDLHLSDHYMFNDFAILYRTNAQSRVMEEALRKRNIPYKIYGGLSFYDRKEIKDIIAYFRLVSNSADIEAFKRIINFPARGIGKTTTDKLYNASIQANVSMWQVSSSPSEYAININSGTAVKIKKFVDLILSFREHLETKTAYDIAYEIIHGSGIYKEFKGDTSVEAISKRENVDELLNALKDFTEIRKEADESATINDFLQEVSLITDKDTDKEEDKNKVTLMTVHASKGLEYKNVFIVGMEEDLFPSPRSVDSTKDLEEERRLFYVAITRAEENCIISFAKSRYKYGTPTFCRPSRFIRDLEAQYIQHVGSAAKNMHETPSHSSSETSNIRKVAPSFYGKGNSIPQTQPKITLRKAIKPTSGSSVSRQTNNTFKSDDPRSIKPGMTVEHERFGKGHVENIEGTGTNIKAMVTFDTAGAKNLLLRFARLKIIS